MAAPTGTRVVAALYDIHGNLPALEAVLDEVLRAGADEVVVGGDVVPGPMPRESVARLLDLDLPVRFIYGNGERDILALARGETPVRAPEQAREALRWVARKLEPDQLEAIGRWPMTTTLEVVGLGLVLFCHATPRDDAEIFTKLTPEERLLPVFESAEADVVVCGHTHMPFDRRVGRVRVVNAGSVGMPFGSPEACWALLHADSIELRRTAYDYAAASAVIRETGFPPTVMFDPERPADERAMLERFEAAALK